MNSNLLPSVKLHANRQLLSSLYRHLRINLIHITLKTDIFSHESRRILFSELSISFWHPRFSLSDKNICVMFFIDQRRHIFIPVMRVLYCLCTSDLSTSSMSKSSYRETFVGDSCIVTKIKLLKTNASLGVYSYSTCL